MDFGDSEFGSNLGFSKVSSQLQGSQKLKNDSGLAPQQAESGTQPKEGTKQPGKTTSPTGLGGEQATGPEGPESFGMGLEDSGEKLGFGGRLGQNELEGGEAEQKMGEEEGGEEMLTPGFDQSFDLELLGTQFDDFEECLPVDAEPEYDEEMLEGMEGMEGQGGFYE